MIFEKFQAEISNSVYDTVDLATKIPNQLEKNLASLESAVNKSKQEIERLKLAFSQPTRIDQQRAELSADERDQADFLNKCVAVCPRLTACQLNTEGRLVCGGVALKPGDSAENIQANWDLIDTCTGADA